MRNLIVGILALSAILGFGTVKAAPIVSTFASTPPGYDAGGYEINRLTIFPVLFLDIEWAMAFTIPAGPNYAFTGFIVPLTFSGSATGVDFTLASDAGGSPGSPLETIAISLSDGSALYMGTSVLQPTLIAGATYWLEAAIDPANVGNNATWNSPVNILNAGLFSGSVADRNPPMFPNWSVTTATQAAFEIDGTPAVAEPHFASVVALLLFSAFCLHSISLIRASKSTL
jgi:hypothetical protein